MSENPRKRRNLNHSGDIERTMSLNDLATLDTQSSSNVKQGDESRILSEIGHLREGQQDIICSFTSEMDKLKTELRDEFIRIIDRKLYDMNEEINRVFREMDKRITGVEQSIACLKDRVDTAVDPNRCVILSGVHYELRENLKEKATRVLQALGPDIVNKVSIVAIQRLGIKGKERNSKQPPLVKIAFKDLDQKVNVLRAKSKLGDSDEFKNSRMWSSKSHAERVADMNFSTLMNSIPGMKNQFRLTAHGKMVPRGQYNKSTSPVDGMQQFGQIPVSTQVLTGVQGDQAQSQVESSTFTQKAIPASMPVSQMMNSGQNGVLPTTPTPQIMNPGPIGMQPIIPTPRMMNPGLSGIPTMNATPQMMNQGQNVSLTPPTQIVNAVPNEPHTPSIYPTPRMVNLGYQQSAPPLMDYNHFPPLQGQTSNHD